MKGDLERYKAVDEKGAKGGEEEEEDEVDEVGKEEEDCVSANTVGGRPWLGKTTRS